MSKKIWLILFFLCLFIVAFGFFIKIFSLIDVYVMSMIWKFMVVMFFPIFGLVLFSAIFTVSYRYIFRYDPEYKWIVRDYPLFKILVWKEFLPSDE